MKAFPIILRIFKALYDDLFLCVVVSLLWWGGVLLVVTAGPATLGLHAVANRAANYRRTSLDFFWSEARAYPWRAWGLLGAILVVGALIAANITFYGSSPAGWARVVTVIWLWVALFYLLISQYLFPLFCQQSDRSIRTTLRNGAVLALRSPVYSLVALLFTLLLLATCLALFLPALLLMPALLALAGNFFVTGLLQEMGLASAPPVMPLRGE